MKKITIPSLTSPIKNPPPYFVDPEATLWRARDAYGEIAGILVTAPGKLDEPIGFVFHDQEKPIVDLMSAAGSISDDPDALDRAIDSTGGFCHIDLRERGRADSKRAMPGWCYSLWVTPDEAGMYGKEQIQWNPFCPIRLAIMLAKRPGAMNSTAVAPKSTTR